MHHASLLVCVDACIIIYLNYYNPGILVCQGVSNFCFSLRSYQNICLLVCPSVALVTPAKVFVRLVRGYIINAC